MELFFDGVLKLVSDASFVNKESGEKVPRFEHIFQVTDELGNKTKVQLFSQKDYSSLLDQQCVGTVFAREYQEGRTITYKLALKGLASAELTIEPIKVDK